jgi:hypothetical protein
MTGELVDFPPRRRRYPRPSGSPPQRPLSALIWELVSLAIADHERRFHGAV